MSSDVPVLAGEEGGGGCSNRKTNNIRICHSALFNFLRKWRREEKPQEPLDLQFLDLDVSL